MSPQQEHDIVEAVLYALRCGCLFPVKYPPDTKQKWTSADMIQWGAMRNLHVQIAKAGRPDAD